MEHRETSRIGEDDGPGPGLDPTASAARPRSRRFPRIVESPAARRLAVDRLGRAVLAMAAVVGLVVVGGSNVSRTVVHWLHRRPEYQIKFGDIVLDPPPPPWIKGGREALLESIRDGRKNLETLSVLDLDLDRLLTDVRRNPWVARADRATKSYPDRVTVALTYREPVALIRAGSGPPIPVDPEGVVLPAEGLDDSKARPLAWIEAEPSPTPPRPGLPWPVEPARGEPISRVIRAARLAGRLKDALHSIGPTDWRPERIDIVVENPKQSGFWVWFDQTLVLWGRYPTLDTPGGPDDLAKWQSLAAKARRDGGLKPLAEDEYLDAGAGLHTRKIPRSSDK